MDFKDWNDAVAALKDSQEAEHDLRELARQSHLFIDKPDGQWEPYWWNASDGKPRYTFDQVGPLVDIVAGEIEQADFDIRVRPAGSNANKDTAELYDGLIRNIENVSNASDIYASAGRSMATGGIDGWRVRHDYADDDTFYQDLFIEPIANFLDSVFFMPFKKPDASDAEGCFVLEAIPKDEYDKKWPDGSGMSIGDNRMSDAYDHKHEQVIIAQFYYIVEETRELFLMSSGRVLENTPETVSVLDELQQMGDQVVNTRKRKKKVCYSRLLDGGDWLNEPQRTVFSCIPVVPCMANFKVFENKVLYRGLVQKLMDPQRVFNYAKSREIEEGALAPRAKYWATPAQVSGFEDTLATMNTNADPLQLYNPDPKAPPGPPVWQGGAQVNPGLQVISDAMSGIVRQAGGLYASSMGDNPNEQSGIAIKRLQDKADTGTVKFFSALERAIRRTGKILIDAIPQVYDTPRQVRILKEDGSFDMAVLNQQIMDQQTGRLVTINDVTVGTYDVVCSAGPSFQNRQQETVEHIISMAQVDPSILELGGDILFSNLDAPGMDKLAERKRQQLFNAGMIPQSQMTDEEKQQAQQMAQQPKEPDPAQQLAMAEMAKAQAETGRVQVQAATMQREQDRKDFEAQQKAQNEQFSQMMKVQQALLDKLETQADVLKTLREAFGVDTAVGPTGLQTLVTQAGKVLEAQRDG